MERFTDPNPDREQQVPAAEHYTSDILPEPSASPSARRDFGTSPLAEALPEEIPVDGATPLAQYENSEFSGSPNDDETSAPAGVPADSSLPTGVSALDEFRKKGYGGGYD